jgi:pyruvate dehydrogenase E2 component (dihydrolipoamide acetyltransferase)
MFNYALKMIITLISAFFLSTLVLLCLMAYKFQRVPPAISESDLYIRVHGRQMRYQVQGNDEPVIILLHGFGGSLDEWTKIMPIIGNRKVIALDLMGFGGSDRLSTSYGLEAQSRQLLAFMDELKITKAIIAGRSMGGSVAAWTAAKAPDKVLGIVLIAPSGYPGSLTYSWPLSWILKPGFWNRLAAYCFDSFFFRRLFPYNVMVQATSVTRSYDRSFADALVQIRQPTLILWSKGDKTVPFMFHKKYLEAISKSDFAEIPPSVGHAVTLGYPEGVADHLKRFAIELKVRK